MQEKTETKSTQEEVLEEAGFVSDSQEAVAFVPTQMPGGPQSSYSNPYPKGVPPFIYQDHAQAQYSTPTTRNPGQFLKPDVGTPGGFENFRHVWKNYNAEFQAGKFLVNAFSPNHLLEDVPDGWRVEPEDLTEFDERFWYELRTATGPKELEARKQAIRDQTKEDEYFANGGWFSSLAGGLAGAISSPGSLYSMKFLTNIKYATVPKTMMMNALSSAPAIGIESFARNSMLQANRMGGTLEDAAFDAVTDTIFGSALMGVGSGLSKVSHDLKLWDTRKAFSLYSNKGIKIDPVFKDGKLTGEATFTPAPGESLSAAEVDLAKAWYTENMDRSGLFSLPVVGKTLEKTMNFPGLRSPAMVAASNRFTATKQWFNKIAGSPFITAGEALGIASQTPAQIIAMRYSAQAMDFTLFARKQWMKANGIDGDTAFAKLKSFKQGISRDRQISETDFGTEALKILSDETYRSEYSEAHAVADQMHNTFVQLNEIYSKLTGRPMFKNPRNAWRYFPVKDNVSAMVNRQDVWEQITSDALANQDKLITEIERPIENSRSRIKQLRDLIKAIDKNDPKIRDYKNQLSGAKGLLERQLEDYNDKIANNLDYGILLEERNPMSGEERNQLRALLEPVKKAKDTVDKHQTQLDYLKQREKESITQKETIEKSKSITNAEVKADELSNKLTATVLEIEEKLETNSKEQDTLKQNHKKAISDLKIMRERLIKKRNAAKDAKNTKLETTHKNALKKLDDKIKSERERIEKAISLFKEKSNLLKTEIAKQKEALKVSRKQFKAKDTVVQEAKFSKEFLEEESQDIAHQIKLEKNRLKLAQEAHEKLEIDLQERAFNREISPNLFMEDGHEIKFHNPDEHPKLRRPFKTDRERTIAVKAMWETRMNLSPNDIVSSVFHHFSPHVSMPNYFKQRTHMVPTSVYVEHGFQDTDVSSLMTSYMQTVGRSLGFIEAMPEFATTRGFDGALRGIKQEYDKTKNEFLSKPESTERSKQLQHLDSDYKNARKFMEQTYNAYFGIDGSDMDSTVRGIATVAKNLTVSALLGGTVAYQIQELGVTMMKHGIMNTLSAGLKPMIQSLFERVRLSKGEHTQAWRNNAADVGLALNTELNARTGKWFNPGVMNEPPGNAMLSMAITSSEKLAHYSMNFFGVNLLQNINQRLAANTFQSRVMRAMSDHLKGTLSNEERIAMAHYGLDVGQDAELFINQMKDAGGWVKGAQHQSMYWRWSDNEAKIKMGDAMRRAVRDTIVDTDVFSSPYWTRNPLLSLVFMFHGWGYNAFNRYAVPLMQRPHAEQVLGATIMVGLSMMSPAILRLANGKDFFKDDETWYHAAFEGLEYSGFLGPNWEMLAQINKGFGDPFFQSTQKRSGYDPHGSFFGPVVGNIFSVGDALGHGIKRDMNQNDLKKLSRIIPGRSQLAVRQGFDYFIAHSGLPEKRPK